MNIIDKVISVFDPQRAIDRVLAREALRQYDAASTDRLNSDWQPAYGTAEQLATGQRDIIRGRARSAEMNSDLAESAVIAVLRNVIGQGIKPQAKVRSGKGKLNGNLNAKIERAWAKWTEAKNADVRGLSNFYELQEMALRRMLYDGEILINKTAQGDYLPLSIQLIEAENIGATGMQNGKNNIINGVEVNEYGKPIAYHVYQSDPMGMRSFNTLRLTTDQAFLLFKPTRPSQIRGVSHLALVLKRIHDIDEYMDADLIAARVSACFSAFITSANSGRQIAMMQRDSKGRPNMVMAPGTVQHLRPGESVSFADPKRNAGTASEYSATQTRRISSGLGMSADIVARNINGNFSAARQNLLEDQKTFRQLQEFVIAHFCMPIWRAFIDALYLAGELPADYLVNKDKYQEVSWLAPGWSWIDPVKEVTANKEAIKSGLTTLEEVCAASGRDWEEVLEQRKLEQDRAAELGVLLDYASELQPLTDDEAQQQEGDEG
ncbi:MAG: phage portal protein [Veillonella caviae]|uniref:phage portal protein n=1 Tax=Veillonella caviae TaxID=248316 RepID=UPI002A90D0F7|nr:phage portal protein [Veillonella caviae]MDY5481796.1 phage portal protein [Veillonella caviae]